MNLILGVATIRELLLEDRIDQSNIGPVENVELRVPDYQRPYKWTPRNAIQLLDDILEARNDNKEVYRVGTLILHRELQDGKEVYNIVDGQQRLITFSLLLSALFESIGKPDRVEEIKFLLQNLNADSATLRNIPVNLNAFRRRLLKAPVEDISYEQHRYNMERLLNFILTQCEFIVVITGNAGEAFQFFDSQNARGKSLYPHDLLKAYHLREMGDTDIKTVEKTVKKWESLDQTLLNEFFGEYIHRLKEWMNGNYAYPLTEHNIYKFKGINKNSRTPYAQFYKSAFSYAQLVNNSAMPFVTGSREVTAFQLNSPIIAGEPFFHFTHYYLDLLKDIRDNSKYEGFYIQDNEIVKTLDAYFQYGKGNRIARLLFDTALLLYVDRFCPPTFPTRTDVELFEQFVVFAFVWAYSLRAQHASLGWQSAQMYVLNNRRDKVNSFNLYKLINESDSPTALLSMLSDRLCPLSEKNQVSHAKAKNMDETKDGVHTNYLHYFRINNFLSE